MKKISVIMILFFLISIAGCTTTNESIGQAGNNQIENNPQTMNEDIVDIEIVDFSYNPNTMTISKGTTVRWRNFDSVRHTITSDEDIFDSGLLSKEESWSHTFNKEGTYNYHCTPHPYMQGTIIVI